MHRNLEVTAFGRREVISDGNKAAAFGWFRLRALSTGRTKDISYSTKLCGKVVLWRRDRTPRACIKQHRRHKGRTEFFASVSQQLLTTQTKLLVETPGIPRAGAGYGLVFPPATSLCLLLKACSSEGTQISCSSSSFGFSFQVFTSLTQGCV